MDLKDIQNLIKFVSKAEVKEVDLEFEDVKIKVVNNDIGTTTTYQTISVQPEAQQMMQMPAQPVQPVAQPVEVPKVEDTSHLIEVKSPMIGTFYRSSGPGKPTFVSQGDEIQVGTVVCMIEAMKLFNEIESEVSGRIVKILVDDASPVEYNQPLFLIEPK